MKTTKEMIGYFKGVMAQHEAVANTLATEGQNPEQHRAAKAHINAYSHVIQKLKEWEWLD